MGEIPGGRNFLLNLSEQQNRELSELAREHVRTKNGVARDGLAIQRRLAAWEKVLEHDDSDFGRAFRAFLEMIR